MTVLFCAFVEARPKKGQAEMNANDDKILPDKKAGKRTRKISRYKIKKFVTVLNENISDDELFQKHLAVDTDLAESLVSNYLNGKRVIFYDHLCAFCIALRFEPHIQRKLFGIFKWKLPDENGNGNVREVTVRYYMDHCYDDPTLTVRKCNKKLCELHQTPLTNKRGGQNG